MCASRNPAVGPQLVVIALMGLGAAACSADSGRFSDNTYSSGAPPRSEVTGSIPQTSVDSRPLPRLAGNAGDGVSGGGRGMGSYQPAGGDVTGSLPPAPPPPAWTWEGGTPVIVEPGETLETISRRYGVPVAAIMEANNITSPALVHPGQHLVIPRHRGPVAAVSPPPQTRIASTAPSPRRSVRRAPRSRRAPAFTSWRRARRCTASRGFMASRCLCSPRPTISRPTPWCGSATALSFRIWERPHPPRRRRLCRAPKRRRRRRANSNLATAEFAAQRAGCRTRRPGRAGGLAQERRTRRSVAVLPLAGARPRHRRLWTEAERLTERRHQSRRA